MVTEILIKKVFGVIRFAADEKSKLSSIQFKSKF